eukprot:13289509-Alexandrium_andersonii.AAC.1
MGLYSGACRVCPVSPSVLAVVRGCLHSVPWRAWSLHMWLLLTEHGSCQHGLAAYTAVNASQAYPMVARRASASWLPCALPLLWGRAAAL